jgi:pimeloyl-ACP methyl ester carboxylesterase
MLRALLIVGALAALAGCGGGEQPSPAKATRTPTPSPTPTPGPPEGEAVTFRASDGVRLRGRSFGEGTTWVVLSHMGKQRSTEEDWLPLANALADAGYRAVIYNRRGVCVRDFDCSEGEHDLDESWRDVVGAVRFARREGAERVALVGANYGAMASLYAVTKENVDVEALVSMAGINRAVEPYEFTRADLRRVGERSLFVSADEDHHNADEVAREWSEWSGGELLMLESDQHGTQMLEDGEETQGPIIERTLAFLQRVL